MKRLLLSSLAVLALQAPMALACTPTVLYGQANAIADIMVAMLNNSNIPRGTFIDKVKFVEGFYVVYTGTAPNRICYTYMAGFTPDCSAHHAGLVGTDDCSSDSGN